MQRLGEFFSRLTRQILPDPMVLACLLTLLTAGLAVLAPREAKLAGMGLAARSLAVGQVWFAGVWNADFLVFALQMCLVLLTGYGLAKAPPATRFLNFLAGRVESNRAAVLLVAAVSCVGCWINWGFGLIAGGLLAARVRAGLVARGRHCSYALIVAAAYSGMMIWHGGLSGSAPLRVAKEGIERITPAAAGPHSSAAPRDAADTAADDSAIARDNAKPIPPIPITRTTLSLPNLGLTLAVFLGVPLLLASMGGEVFADDGAEAKGTEDEPFDSDRLAGAGPRTLADAINHSRIVPLLIALGFLIVLGNLLWEHGAAAINLNVVNALFLALGLLLHRNLYEYVAAATEGGRAITGIVLQFPLYAGIQAMMFGAGLAAAMSQWFVEASGSAAALLHLSPAHTFPVAALLSAGLVNIFVPSGGGQWIVQGPLMCSAAESLGTPIEQAIMAVSYGDQWTNMIQPFWAIPLMGLTGVNVRRFMGYCTLLMLLAFPALVAALLCMG